MTKITTFKISSVQHVPSADCHTVEQYCMSAFGQETSPNPDVVVEIESVAELRETAPEEQPQSTEQPTENGDGKAADGTAEAAS